MIKVYDARARVDATESAFSGTGSTAMRLNVP